MRLTPALGVTLEPKAIQLVIKCIRGVLAVHSSDHYTAHHISVGRDLDGKVTAQSRVLYRGTRIRDGVRSMNSESEYRIPIQPVMRDSFD